MFSIFSNSYFPAGSRFMYAYMLILFTSPGPISWASSQNILHCCLLTFVMVEERSVLIGVSARHYRSEHMGTLKMRTVGSLRV